MRKEPWHCVKCDSKAFELGEFRASGGFWTKIFDIQNKKFKTVSCSHCGFTEVYKADSSMAGNVFDFLTG